MLAATSTDHARWHVIPADHKWARNYCIAHILAATLRQMDPKAPLIADESLIHKRFK
jgi:polyphosphate kinase 2 (PPK2 family)